VRFDSIAPIQPNDVITSIQAGKSDFAVVSTYAIGRFDPAYQVFSLPFLFEDLGAVTRFQEAEGGQVLANSLHGKGVDRLAFIHEGMSYILADKPIRLPNDLKGKKLATLGTQTPTADFWNMLGAMPTFVPPAEIVTALNRGNAEAYVGPPTLLSASNLPKHLDVLTATRHEYLGYVLIANPRFVEALPKELANELRAAAFQARASANAIALERTRSQFAAYQKAGIQIVGLKANELSAWRGASIQEWSKYEPIVGKDLVRLAQASGTGGGGDPCPVLKECRCRDRSCKVDCCK
jgi:C4-dicarboxylate-binding protein DctP